MQVNLIAYKISTIRDFQCFYEAERENPRFSTVGGPIFQEAFEGIVQSTIQLPDGTNPT